MSMHPFKLGDKPNVTLSYQTSAAAMEFNIDGLGKVISHSTLEQHTVTFENGIFSIATYTLLKIPVISV